MTLSVLLPSIRQLVSLKKCTSLSRSNITSNAVTNLLISCQIKGKVWRRTWISLGIDTGCCEGKSQFVCYVGGSVIIERMFCNVSSYPTLLPKRRRREGDDRASGETQWGRAYQYRNAGFEKWSESRCHFQKTVRSQRSLSLWFSTYLSAINFVLLKGYSLNQRSLMIKWLFEIGFIWFPQLVLETAKANLFKADI